MHGDTRIFVSDHAIERYRERVGPITRKQLVAKGKESLPASKRTRKALRKDSRNFNRLWRGRFAGYLATVEPDAVDSYGSGPLYVLKQLKAGEFVMLTVLDRGMFEIEKPKQKAAGE